MTESTNKCPGCGRHCDLSAPSCPRGEAYARGEAAEKPVGERRGRENREWTHEHGEHGRHGREGGAREERAHGRGQHGCRKPLDQEEYNALGTDAKLGAKLRELNHMSRFVMDSRGGQGKILRILAEEGTMTQRALTERLGIQPGSASEVIGKLERAALLERSENASDRRTADIRLTELGREQAEAARKEEPALFAALSEEEKLQLLALFEKLSADWHSRFPRESLRPHRRRDEE